MPGAGRALTRSMIWVASRKAARSAPLFCASCAASCLVARQLGPFLDEAWGGGGDFEFGLQRAPDFQFAVAPGHRLRAGPAEQRQQFVHQRRIVLRHHAQGIARHMDQVRAVQRQLDVARILRRAAAGDADVFHHLRQERVVFAVRSGRWRLRRRAHGGQPGGGMRTMCPGRHCRLDLLQHRIDPAAGIGLVIDVAIAARKQALRAQFFQAAVQRLAGLAEKFIGRIAQPQHREAQLRQRRRLASGQEFEERQRRLGRLAFAMGAGDEQHRFLILQRARLVARQVFRLRRNAGLLRAAGKLARQFRRVAGFAGIQNLDRGCRLGHLAGGRDRGRRNRRRLEVAARFGHAGKIAAYPERLLDGERATERAQQFALGVVNAGAGQRGRHHVHIRIPLRIDPLAGSPCPTHRVDREGNCKSEACKNKRFICFYLMRIGHCGSALAEPRKFRLRLSRPPWPTSPCATFPVARR